MECTRGGAGLLAGERLCAERITSSKFIMVYFDSHGEIPAAPVHCA